MWNSSLSLHHRKRRSKFTPQLLIYYMKYENRKAQLEQCQKQSLQVFYGNALFKMSQNSQETLVPEETPVNFAKFLRTSLLQNNSGRLLLKCGHFNKARDIMGEVLVLSSWSSDRWVLLLVPGVAERNKKAGRIQGCIFLFLGLVRWNEKGKCVTPELPLRSNTSEVV